MIELAHMSEAQKRAYVLADNQLALNAGWDEALLRLELADLSELGFDLGLIGFGEGELERLLAGDSRTGLTEDDEAPALPEQAVTQPGDLWVMGEHRLLCGDATVLADVERVLDGQLADMTFTDPPYNVDYGSSAKDKLRGNKRKILNDDLGTGFEAFLHDACANILAVTKGAVYVCMSSSELHTLQRAFTAAGGKWSTFVIWAKHTFTLGRADYQRQYEPILYGWPRGSRSVLVRGPGSGRRLVRGQAGAQRSASHDEAGRPGRAGDPQLEQEPRHRARPVRWLGLHPDRMREDRAAGKAGGARPEVRGRDHPALAGVQWRHGDPGRQGPELQ